MRNFIFSAALTVMDIVVFGLCVDKGLSPVSIVGACYIALRLFGKDSQNAVNLLEPFCDKIGDLIKQLKAKYAESHVKIEVPEETIDG